jgi:hypothetical protein
MARLIDQIKKMPKALAALTALFAAFGLLCLVSAILPSTWRVGDGILAVTTAALMLLLVVGFYKAQNWARYVVPIALAGNTVYMAVHPWPNEGPHQWLGSFILAIPACWYFLWKTSVLRYFLGSRRAEPDASPNGGLPSSK